MKGKILNLGLILASLAGYLEWGGDNRVFLLQAEVETLPKLFTDLASVAHPLILFPLAGQLILIITLFQKSPNKALTFLGLAGIGSLLTCVLVIGIMVPNFWTILSTLPFFLIGGLTIRHQGAKTDAETPRVNARSQGEN